MVTSVSNSSQTPQVQTNAKTGMAALGQADFLKLLTTQLAQQDPTDPVDNKEMLAQMAQFSSVAGITDMSETLKAISAKLDVVMAAKSGTTTATDGASGTATNS